MEIKKEKLQQWLPWLSKAITAGIIVFIILKIRGRRDEFSTLLMVMQRDMSVHHLVILMLLMPVNWGLEIAKWHFLTNKISSISWKNASAGVLNGLALGFITPHAIGDYVGRIAWIRNEDSVQLASMVFISRSAQLVATLICGCWGISVHFSLGPFVWIASGLVVLSSIWLIIYLLKKSLVTESGMLQRFVSSFRLMSKSDLLWIICLALVRYLVFAFQFALAIRVFATIPWELAGAGTTWILLIKSLAPAFNFLSDIGIREASAILFFESTEAGIVPVVVASLLIWCINILLPTLAGAVVILRSKYS